LSLPTIKFTTFLHCFLSLCSSLPKSGGTNSGGIFARGKISWGNFPGGGIFRIPSDHQHHHYHLPNNYFTWFLYASYFCFSDIVQFSYTIMALVNDSLRFCQTKSIGGVLEYQYNIHICPTSVESSRPATTTVTSCCKSDRSLRYFMPPRPGGGSLLWRTDLVWRGYFED